MANFQAPPEKTPFIDITSADPTLPAWFQKWLASQRPSGPWLRWCHSLVDWLNRPRTNRVAFTLGANYSVTSATDVSVGSGTGAITPKRYGEITLWGQVGLSNNTAGDAFVLRIYRTTGNIPAQGAAPGGGDVKVATISDYVSAGGQSPTKQIFAVDSGISVSTAYKYYFTISNGGTGGQVTIFTPTSLIATES